MEQHKKWLKATAKYFDTSEEDILDGYNKRNKVVVKARITFYYLCFKAGIDLYRLSETIGKHRVTVAAAVNRIHNRDVNAEREIIALESTRIRDNTIEAWMDRGEEGEIIATALIAKKQIANLECEFL